MSKIVVVCAALVCAVMLSAGCGSSSETVAQSLDDPVGDVARGTGPDIVAVTVERRNETIRFRVRFSGAPPLAASEVDRWVDMILIGIDVPPLGPPPATPGGDWPGADFYLGAHATDRSGRLVRLVRGVSAAEARSEKLPDVPIEIDGGTLSFSVPRQVLGDPASFALAVATAREGGDRGEPPADGRPDLAPDTGTWLVELSG